MRQIKTILTIIFFLSFLSAYPQDERETPETFIFIFHNNDTIKLNNPSDSLLEIYSDDIINNKKALIKAELFFKNGEILTFKAEGNKWTSIIISDGKMEINIPDTTLEMISEIHFNTISLVWDSNFEKAFAANSFSLGFKIGKERSFHHFPKLILYFSEQKYAKVEIIRPPSWPYPEYVRYYYDSAMQLKIPIYNYSNKWDLDGDKKNDSIFFIGNGGAHTYFHLRIVLTTDNLIRDFPTFQIDMPYLGKIKTLKELGKHPGVQFVVYDFDSDGIKEIYLNIDNHFGSIPKKMKRQGLTSPYILIDFSDNKLKFRNYEIK